MGYLVPSPPRLNRMIAHPIGARSCRYCHRGAIGNEAICLGCGAALPTGPVARGAAASARRGATT